MEARPTSCDTDRLLYCCRHSVVLFFLGGILCFNIFLVPVVLACSCRGTVFFSFVDFDILLVILC
jgi:hypothetical protein